jgi:NADH-quinone oxidoreductase subunit J
MSVINLVFFSLSFVAILSAFLVVIARNQVHSVMWLIVTFFSVAGLFISMGAEFLAMVLMIVYIGAIAVLFLFVVMLLGVDVMQMRKVSWNHLPLAMCHGEGSQYQFDCVIP